MAENLLAAISATLDGEWVCHFVGLKSRFLLMGGAGLEKLNFLH